MIAWTLLVVGSLGLDALEAEAECMCAFAGVVGSALEGAESGASFLETASESAEEGPGPGSVLRSRVRTDAQERGHAEARRVQPAMRTTVPVQMVDREETTDIAKSDFQAADFAAFAADVQKEACRGGTREKGMTTAKELLGKYGPAYLVTSVSLAAVSYAGCYALVAKGVDVAALLARLGLQAKVNEKVGTASIAYVAHKAASPLRFPPTVALTPYVAKTLFGKEREDLYSTVAK